MAHVHVMRDTDSHFIVDPLSRTIAAGTPPKSVLIQHDHNSEILSFELPRYVDGHDMLLCNQVEIHYRNKEDSSREAIDGVYLVTDFAESEDEQDTIVWTWIVSHNSTQLVGPLTFAFRFACINDDNIVEYAWHTAPYSGIRISEGHYFSEEVLADYIDLIAQWEQEFWTKCENEMLQTKLEIQAHILTNIQPELLEVKQALAESQAKDNLQDVWIHDNESNITTILERLETLEYSNAYGMVTNHAMGVVEDVITAQVGNAELVTEEEVS